MARFRGLHGDDQRGSLQSAVGRKGFTSIVNGWDMGFEVRAYVDKLTGLDTFEVWNTGGSNGGGRSLIFRTQVPITTVQQIQDKAAGLGIGSGLKPIGVG